MEQFHLPLFVANTLLVLLDASLGYFLAPRLLSSVAPDDPGVTFRGIRSTRRLLPVIVALYMLFNCLGYFQARTTYLMAVTGLLLTDLGLQMMLRRRADRYDRDEGDADQ